MPSSLPWYIQEKFKPNKWYWYLINVKDWHKPRVLRKHFRTPKQAEVFKKKYVNENWDIAKGKLVIEMDIKDSLNSLQRKPKYEYPKQCKTQYQRLIFRGIERRKLKKNCRRMKPTEKDCWEVVEDKTIRFFTRLKRYRGNYWACSKPVPGINDFRKQFKSFQDIVILANIVRCLQDYHYDIGDFYIYEVALKMYEVWYKKVKKVFKGSPNPHDEDQIIAEFKARGFVPYSEFKVNTKEDNYVETVNLKDRLVYPKLCYHNFHDRKRYKNEIYELFVQIGIPGYTRAYTSIHQKK